jgi:hypothetical protein
MKRKCITHHLLFLVLVVMAIVAMTVPANATFVMDPNPGGDKYFLDKADGVSSFSGFVGAQSSGPIVNTTTIGSVDTASGWANIKPIKDGTLTSLTFTPDIANTIKFNDFSFRAQLLWDLDDKVKDTGKVDVIVTDQYDIVSIINFTDLAGPNADFGTIGVVSNDGEWIKSVEILIPLEKGIDVSFKEVKQVSFSSVPEPSTFLLLGAGLGGLWFLRRRK